MNDVLKLIGASEAEMRDPEVQAALKRVSDNETEVDVAAVVTEDIEPPTDTAMMIDVGATERTGLEKYGFTIRKQSLVWQGLIHRVNRFAMDPETKEMLLDPETDLPWVILYSLIAPIREVREMIRYGEKNGPDAFMEKVTEWIDGSGLPDKVTAETMNDYRAAFERIARMSPKSDEIEEKPDGTFAVKKSAASGS